MKHIKKYFFLPLKLVLSFILIFLPALLSLTRVYAEEEAPANLKLYAQSAVLMDAGSGRILYEKNGQEILPMASTTKIMTCILALEYGNLEDYASASSYAASMPKVKLYVKSGEYYKLEDLLYSLMLESHNDSAVVIAEHIAGSTESFADMMNQKARDIGCFDTFFITPNGLDATATDKEGTVKAHSTTAADLARIMSYCIMDSPKKEEFLEITRTSSYSFGSFQEKEGDMVPSGRTFQCNNHNAFLSMMEGALSGKTGFTGNAGYCYVGALERDDRTFVVALLACGWPNNKTYKWSDTKKLMKYGLKNYQKRDLTEEAVSEEWLKEIPVSNAKTTSLYGKLSVNVSVKDEIEAPSFLMKEEEQIDIRCDVKKQLEAPVEQGQEVGKIQYLLDGDILWERKICAEQSAEKTDFFWFFKMAVFHFLVCS